MRIIFRQLAALPTMTNDAVEAVIALPELFISGTVQMYFLPSRQRRDASASAFAGVFRCFRGVGFSSSLQLSIVGMAADAIARERIALRRAVVILGTTYGEEHKSNQ